MTTDLADAKASAQRACATAETEYREAYGAFRTAHSAAVAQLAKTNLAKDADVLGWLRARTGPARSRWEAAEEELRLARIEELAVDDAIAAQAQATKAARDAERYGDKLDHVRDTAEAALALASRALMKIDPAIKRIDFDARNG